MGYRHYFYLVDREEVDKVRNLPYKEIVNYAKEHYPQSIEEDELGDGEVNIYFDFPGFLSQELLHEFGKLYFCNTVSRIYSKGEPLFRDKEMQEYLKEYTPYLIGKEGMLEVIKCYRDKVIHRYAEILKACEKVEANLYRNRPNRKLFNWKLKRIYHLQDSLCTDSGIEELADVVFNLLHLLKTIDWDKKALLFYGY